MAISELVRLDSRAIDIASDEILCFVAVRNETLRLPYFLRYYRQLGIHRFLFVDNESTDGTVDYILAQPDCHCYSTAGAYFRENVEPPGWTNALSNVFGHGHWCITVDADELLVYPHSETLDLSHLCAFLATLGDEALFCPMIDMYCDGPIIDVNYRQGEPFHEACPLLDPEPGWIWNRDDAFPPMQMFGGVRQRVFWTGALTRQTPPCISKVPLVRWQKGMKYLHSMHLHSGAKLSELWGGLLHFKFLSGFYEFSRAHLNANTGFVEKSLEEREIYLFSLHRYPKLSMKNGHSVYYKDSQQLVNLHWLKKVPSYESYLLTAQGDFS